MTAVRAMRPFRQRIRCNHRFRLTHDPAVKKCYSCGQFELTPLEGQYSWGYASPIETRQKSDLKKMSIINKIGSKVYSLKIKHRWWTRKAKAKRVLGIYKAESFYRVRKLRFKKWLFISYNSARGRLIKLDVEITTLTRESETTSSMGTASPVMKN